MIAASLLAAAVAVQGPAATTPLYPVAVERADPAPGPVNTNARARYPLSRYVSISDDYPAAALRNNEQGRVAFALAIDANGRVNGCRITRSSGSAALDAATCRIMRARARYTPARDARGIAVPDADVGVIDWILKED